MSSYLATLATRELGSDGIGHPSGRGVVQGVVAPRHVGRYEPWAMPLPEVVERDATSTVQAKVNAAVLDVRRGDAPAAGRDTRVDANPSAPVGDRNQPWRSERDVVAPREHRTDVTSTMSRPSAPTVSSAHTPLLAAPVAAPRPSTPVHDAITTRVERTERETVVSSRRDKNAVVGPAQVVAPAMRVPVSLVVTPRRVEARATAPSSAAAAPHDTPPAVVVTIGRIDVRAVTAPAPTRAARSASAPMSLDDYLRERTRGLR